MLEPLIQCRDRHGAQGLNILAVNQHIFGLFAQMETLTDRADGLAFVSRQHHFILDAVVLLLLQFLEEIVQASEILVARPDELFLFLRQRIEWRVNREVELRRVVDERIQPRLCLLALPAGNRLFVNGFRLIRHHQINIYAHNRSNAFAFRTGTDRVVEVKQVFARFDELNPVRLEALGEHFLVFVRPYTAFALAFKECCLHAVCKAVARCLLMVHNDTVH